MASIDEILSQPRDEHGRFAPKAEPVEEPSAPPAEKVESQPVEPVAAAPPAAAPAPVAEPTKPPEVRGLEAGIAAERDKRQRAEAQAEETLRKLNETLQRLEQFQKPKEEPKPPPDYWTDPAAATRHTVREELTTSESAMRGQLFELHEELQRSRNTDYDYAREAFSIAAQADQSLIQQLQAKPPREAVAFIYSEGKKHFETQKQKWKALLEPEFRPAAAPANAAPPPPASLNTEASPAAVPAYAGPKPLGTLLVNGNKF